MLVFMFTGRPMPAKRRMIKKRQVAKELDMINQEKQKLIAQSSLLPPGAVMGPGGAGGNLPVGGMPQNENMSLLALPPPISGPIAGQLALPGPPGFAKPPAPNYPPPPGFAKALPAPQEMLPPIHFARAGMPQLPALPSFAPQPKATTPRLAIGAGVPSMKPPTPGRGPGHKPPGAPPALMPGPPSMPARPPTPPGMPGTPGRAPGGIPGAPPLPPGGGAAPPPPRTGGGPPMPGGPMPAPVPGPPPAAPDVQAPTPPRPPPAFAGAHESEIPIGDSARSGSSDGFTGHQPVEDIPNLLGSGRSSSSVGSSDSGSESSTSARDTGLGLDSPSGEANLVDSLVSMYEDLGLDSPGNLRHGTPAVTKSVSSTNRPELDRLRYSPKAKSPGFEGGHRMMPPPPMPGAGQPPPPPRPPGLNFNNMSVSGGSRGPSMTGGIRNRSYFFFKYYLYFGF